MRRSFEESSKGKRGRPVTLWWSMPLPRWSRQAWWRIFSVRQRLRAPPSIPERLAGHWGVSKLSQVLHSCGRKTGGRDTLKKIVVPALVVLLLLPPLAQGEETAPPSPAHVAQAVREYRMENEDRIVRELTEFLAIPNVASDTANIQKNAAHLMEMLEARGIETHLLPIAGRGPVVFGKLISAEAKRTVIFYAHYDGQPVDPAAWTCGKPFEPVIRIGVSNESCGKEIPPPQTFSSQPIAGIDDWRIY